MEKISAAVAWRLADRLRGGSDPKQQQSGTATFSRMDDDGTAWIRIPGNDFDTPVEGGVYTDAQEGDAVPYSIAGGQVAVTGNVTSPSVGQRVVDATIAPVRAAVSRATESIVMVRSIADAAKRVADAIDQHFWTDTSGIHVTHATQEDWAANQSGPNVLINSVGQLFRDGLNNLVAITTESGARAISFYDGLGNAAGNILAYFGSDGARIGRSNRSHLELDYHSLQLLDKESRTYFHVSDLRDESGTADIIEHFRSYDYVTHARAGQYHEGLTLSYYPELGLFGQSSVVVFGTEYTWQQSGIDQYTYRFELDGSGAYLLLTPEVTSYNSGTIDVTYRTTNAMLKALTFGTRKSGKVLGMVSSSFGRDCEASGSDSAAFGYNTIASGDNAIAAGRDTEASVRNSEAHGIGTVACGTNAQFVTGRYNSRDYDGTYALIIGNGTSNDSRSNAITVDWDGNVDAAGRITQAVDSTTATVGAASASIGTNSIRRAGNVVTVTLANIQLASAIANNGYSGTIATVPAGYRPASNAYGACYAAGANLGGSYARITTAGIVAIRNQSGASIAASTTVLPALSITYIID